MKGLDGRWRAWVGSALVALLLSGGCQRGPWAADAAPGSGIAFVSDRDGNEEIYLVQPDGSGLMRLTEEPAYDGDPAWSPDGRQIAFRSRRDGSSDIFAMGADGSSPTNLARDEDGYQDEFHPAWHPRDELLAIYTDRYATLPCAGHQLALLPIGGGAAAIQLVGVPPGNQISLAWSPDGTRLVFSSCRCGNAESDLYLWTRETGQVEQLTDASLASALYPAWSHDGRQIAFASNAGGQYDIYRLELATGALTNLTNHPARDTWPAWSPDDTQIAFVTDRDGNAEIYVMQADGTDPRNLTQHPAHDAAPAWSPVR